MPLYRSRFANRSVTKPTGHGRSSKSPVWIVPAGVSVALVILSILAYFIGVSRQDVYLGLRGLDWKLFPLDKPDYIYLGAITTIESILTALLAISKKWELLLGAATFGLTVGVAVVLDSFFKSRAPLRRGALRQWQKETIFLIFMTVGTPTLFFIPVLALAVVLLLPAAIGEAVAKQTVSRENAIIQNGCDRAPPHMGCFELQESSKVVARGFLLHGTQKSILLHDGINASMWSLDKRDLVRASDQTKEMIADNIAKSKKITASEPSTSPVHNNH